jgi:ADP-ribosylation factor GTPase-activating protein 1
MEFSVKQEQNANNRNNIFYTGNPYIKIIEEKINDELNKYCVECGNENPEYISINNGIFICAECAQNHFKFPKNISEIIKNDRKSLTFDEIQPLLCGGNRSLLDFINNEFPKLSEFPPHILYRTEAMVYYRRNLQYLIKGGIPPVKPSMKNAYNITNYYHNYNSNNNNNIATENDYYTISHDRGLVSNKNFDYFYHSGNNFTKGRKIRDNNNYYENKFANTICNEEINYNNFIIKTPSQVNFQNNNNIIIRNVDNNNINNDLIYSPQTIKINFNENKQKTKDIIKINNKIHNSMSGYLSNINEIYKKPKLILSPKPNCQDSISINGALNRNSSVDIIKKNNHNHTCQQQKDSSENGEIISLKIEHSRNSTFNNTFSNNWKFKKICKNLSHGSHSSYNLNNKKPNNNYVKKNKFVHKSLSQKAIKDDGNNFNANKYLMIGQTESNISFPLRKILNNKKRNLRDIEELQTIPNKKSLNIMNTKSFFNNNLVKNYLKNKEKTSAEETYSEVESIPIKINLKKPKNSKNMDKSNFYSKSKKDLRQNDKTKMKIIPIKKEKIIKISNNQKENRKNAININIRNNLGKKNGFSEKRIQVESLKNFNSNKNKTMEIKVKNAERNNFSLRNRIRMKNKNK